MATVELRFSALPAHVRTARLVAAAVARRSGVDEAVLDEVRLAVGEACSRAVDLHRRYCPDEMVSVVLDDEVSVFRVAVHDHAPPDSTREAEAGPAELTDLAAAVDLDTGPLPAGVGLAVISGLVDDVDVVGRHDGTVVHMRWATPLKA